jgi:predicted site-specific integrase-resolvase
MNLAAWAERDGVARGTAYRRFRADLLPVSAQRVAGAILVDDPADELGRVVRPGCMRRCLQLIRNPVWIGRWRG